jgi:hypothetical protein
MLHRLRFNTTNCIVASTRWKQRGLFQHAVDSLLLFKLPLVVTRVLYATVAPLENLANAHYKIL